VLGPRSIEGHYEEELAAVAMLEVIKERAADFDGVVIACYGDPGLPRHARSRQPTRWGA
jgi:allantoin racemase